MRMGAQIALYPMSDRFIDVILPCIEAVKGIDGLDVSNDDLSTLLLGESNLLFAAVRDMFVQAASGGVHVVLTALFSRGCPGDSYCCGGDAPAAASETLESSEAPSEAPPAALPPSPGAGRTLIAAQYSLYPLGTPGYMNQISAAVAGAREEGSFTASKNFCTRLDGSADSVFNDLYRGFITAEAPHTVLHAAVSANSPSVKSQTENQTKSQTIEGVSS